jgi:hypothetical protein
VAPEQARGEHIDQRADIDAATLEHLDSRRRVHQRLRSHRNQESSDEYTLEGCSDRRAEPARRDLTAQHRKKSFRESI